jgi:hypothetical protein
LEGVALVCSDEKEKYFVDLETLQQAPFQSTINAWGEKDKMEQMKLSQLPSKLERNAISQITVIYTKYRIAFALDITPSMAVINCVNGELLWDKLYQSLEMALRKFLEPIPVGKSGIVVSSDHISQLFYAPFLLLA